MSWVLPTWLRWAALAVVVLAAYALGRIDGTRIEGAKHLAYLAREATQTTKLIQAREKVVTKIEVKYRDRIRTIRVKGDTVIKEVPVYVTQADNARCTINAGFVRNHDAAWSGEPAGPAAESDRQPAGVSLAQVAETDDHNAAACRQWREQALGWREFYGQLRHVDAGK